MGSLKVGNIGKGMEAKKRKRNGQEVFGCCPLEDVNNVIHFFVSTRGSDADSFNCLFPICLRVVWRFVTHGFVSHGLEGHVMIIIIIIISLLNMHLSFYKIVHP